MNTGMPDLNNRPSSVASLPTSENSSTPKATPPSSAQAISPQQPAPVNKISSANNTETPSDSEKTNPSLQEVIQISERLNETIQTIQRDISFSVDDSLGEVIIKVIDRETQETIRQIPSEEMLNISRNIEEVKSLLFDKIKA